MCPGGSDARPEAAGSFAVADVIGALMRACRKEMGAYIYESHPRRDLTRNWKKGRFGTGIPEAKGLSRRQVPGYRSQMLLERLEAPVAEHVHGVFCFAQGHGDFGDRPVFQEAHADSGALVVA